MTLENLAITKTNDLPIKHVGKVLDGKVRSFYDLSDSNSKKLCKKLGVEDSKLGIMVISDRISSFECIWQGETLKGVPSKGAALNAVSKYWFDKFDKQGLAGNHIVHKPHPLVWIVQKAEPVMIEAIARQYITGSMWRDYVDGTDEICGIQIPEGLQKNQKLNELFITPSTKGILTGIPGVEEKDDENISRQQIFDNYKAFNFKSVKDIELYEKLLVEGFNLISKDLDEKGMIFVDTKFEFGYVKRDGKDVLVYIDEIGTPDSSRIWNQKLYNEQNIAREDSKEFFRKKLQSVVPDKDVLTNKKRKEERIILAETFRVPDEIMLETSNMYREITEQITGRNIPSIYNAEAEIIASLAPFQIIE